MDVLRCTDTRCLTYVPIGTIQSDNNTNLTLDFYKADLLTCARSHHHHILPHRRQIIWLGCNTLTVNIQARVSHQWQFIDAGQDKSETLITGLDHQPSLDGIDHNTQFKVSLRA